MRIAGWEWTELSFVVVRVADGANVGRGEASGVYYRGETPATMTAQIYEIAGRIGTGFTRAELEHVLPAGGARNALDAALWDLEAQQAGKPVWKLAGLEAVKPLLTVFTIGVGAPGAVAQQALEYAGARILKLKLAGDGADAARLHAVRAVRPDVRLCVDANQSLRRSDLLELLPAFRDAGVEMIEQPFRIGSEADLDGLHSPIPIAADESVQDIADLPALSGRFDIVNIKLDKCGGLTHGLAMARAARAQGLRVMVGNMGGTSLSTAPAFVLGQICDFVDLDGSLPLERDREPGAVYRDGFVWCPDDVWGGGSRAAVR